MLWRRKVWSNRYSRNRVWISKLNSGSVKLKSDLITDRLRPSASTLEESTGQAYKQKDCSFIPSKKKQNKLKHQEVNISAKIATSFPLNGFFL